MREKLNGEWMDMDKYGVRWYYLMRDGEWEVTGKGRHGTMIST